ncbi:ROK family transcriptional regulator [Mangrovihabitans endophyticus]|uniref:Sugar kinase n=1 Tax=Mangrovihabitans endophyticus TaxID=1751298 RepID=A0A8J3FRB6_9ACTN|nr:ROK family protein [Mangrovihabitans endophyticus]GGL08209.1 sugar kinase [Mangrovihabitans endophyticus]
MARRETAAGGPGSRALVVDVIRSAGAVSRVELTDITGLTQPTISNIVRDLLAEGIVRETGSSASARGKPRTLLAINPTFRYGVGFHLGADTMTCVAIDLTGGVVGREVVSRAPDDQLAERLAAQYDEFVAGLDLPRGRVDGLAVVAPTPPPGSSAEAAGAGSWLGRARGELRDRIGKPVIVENDAAAAALGEFWSRRISREQAFGCIYVSTGIGAGFVFNGALLRGAGSDAGELGHVSIRHDGRPCPCGNRGCVERYASMVATVDAARDRGELGRRLNLRGATSVSHAYDLVARAAVRGDDAALQVVDQAARYLAVAATSVVNLLDLGRLVLTGPGVALAGSVYARRVRAHLDETAHARRRHGVRVELSAQPRDAASIGAAALVVQAAVAPGHSPDPMR